MRTEESASTQRHGDPHDRGCELDVGDVDAVEAQEALECCCDAHGRGTSRNSVVEDPRTLVSARARCADSHHRPDHPATTRASALIPPTSGSGEPYNWLQRLTPFWFHVWVYRHIFGAKDAGKPGYGPYRTYRSSVLTLNVLIERAAVLGLTVNEVHAQSILEVP